MLLNIFVQTLSNKSLFLPNLCDFNKYLTFQDVFRVTIQSYFPPGKDRSDYIYIYI